MKPDLLTDPLLQRLLVTLTLVALGLVAFRLLNHFILARLRSRRISSPAPGMPVLLYFTTPACAPCKTIQRPAIRRLEELSRGRLKVVEIDAAAQPDVASQWGVLSVPTTFVLDPAGRPLFVNHGVISAEKLLNQFKDLLTE